MGYWGDTDGSNMRPLGGVLGGMPAFGGATEHQGNGTPHFHCEGHVVCCYQYGTLAEIGEKIKAGMLSAAAVKTYQEWQHKEEPMDHEDHAAFLEHVDSEWQARFSNESHAPMCFTPAYLQTDAAERNATLWSTAMR